MSTKAKTPELARLKGRRIAARMLYEVERVAAYENSITGMGPFSLYAEYRYKGEPQDNIVLRYLQRAAAQGDDCVAGFCSALTDQIGGAEFGCTNFPVVYMKATEQAISEGDAPTREQVLLEHELAKRKANHPEAVPH